MSLSILSVLATLPSGDMNSPLSFDELGKYLHEQVGGPSEDARNERHVIRDQLYRDGGVDHMKRVIEQVFRDKTVKDLRKKWVEHARFNNPLKRIVNELATVYAEPAKRTVVQGDDTYQQLLKDVRMDEEMLQLGRLLNLHRTLLVGFRVRKVEDGSAELDANGEIITTGRREPVIDVATPSNVRAVLHPNDDKLVVGWLIKSARRTARTSDEQQRAAWVLWTDHEVLDLTGDFKPMVETYKEHGLGVCPWVPVALGPPAPGFWPGEEGEDLVAAHVAIWFTNILLLKEEKSATKQRVISGDTSNTARGQSGDTEVDVEIGDGAAVNTVDMSMDLEMFTGVADHVLSNAANNYGMSAALVKHEGVQSAEARELMRVPLRELRLHQQVPLRRFEEHFVVVMAAVLLVDLPARAFDPTGFQLQFGEAQTPLSRKDELNLFIAGRTAGVDDTVDYLMRAHPGLDAERAEQLMLGHIAVETRRQIAMRPLQAVSGADNAGTDPKANGDQGGRPVVAEGGEDDEEDPEF